MKYKSTLLLLILFLFDSCKDQHERLKRAQFISPRTTVEKRNEFKKKMYDLLLDVENLEIYNRNEKKWLSAFWAMGLTRYKSEQIKQQISTGLKNFQTLSLGLQRALLESALALYKNEFNVEVARIIKQTQNPKIFAMAITYFKNNIQIDKKTEFLFLLKSKFPKWQDNPILFLLKNDLEISRKDRLKNRPALADLFIAEDFKSVPVIFSVQRLNRDFPGITFFKKSDGNFARDVNDQIISITHFARSNANMPGYFTNGNTPEGIYAIVGIDYSENVFIGSSPTLQTRLPFEISVSKFYDNKKSKNSDWTIEEYLKIIPPSWQNYLPIYEAYYAGAAGRSEIIAHGTTINPEFYEGLPFYPLTPSLGCMTALELWDAQSGECRVSDQLTLINTWNSLNMNHGYFVLIVLDDKQQPVILHEILPAILESEETNHIHN